MCLLDQDEFTITHIVSFIHPFQIGGLRSACHRFRQLIPSPGSLSYAQLMDALVMVGKSVSLQLIRFVYQHLSMIRHHPTRYAKYCGMIWAGIQSSSTSSPASFPASFPASSECHDFFDRQWMIDPILQSQNRLTYDYMALLINHHLSDYLIALQLHPTGTSHHIEWMCVERKCDRYTFQETIAWLMELYRMGHCVYEAIQSTLSIPIIIGFHDQLCRTNTDDSQMFVKSLVFSGCYGSFDMFLWLHRSHLIDPTELETYISDLRQLGYPLMAEQVKTYLTN